MKIKAESTKPSNKKTPILCAFVLENSNEPLGLGKIHEKINSSVKESIKETKGKVGEISIIQTLGITPANKILIAGLGPKNKLSTDVLRNVTGKIAQKTYEFSIVIPIGFPIDSDSSISAVVEGTMLSLYSFDKFKKEKSEKSPDLSILVSNSQNAQKVISQDKLLQKEHYLQEIPQTFLPMNVHHLLLQALQNRYHLRINSNAKFSPKMNSSKKSLVESQQLVKEVKMNQNSSF